MKQEDYAHRGAWALVQLHEHHMREFLATWREADAAGVAMPQTSDPSYESLETLLRHVLRAARGYMVWMCEQLGLPDPGIEPTPEPEVVAAEADGYLEHVLTGWNGPLVGLTEKAADGPVYPSRWGTDYCIDAMLEHAVMHPIRHTYQLRELMGRG